MLYKINNDLLDINLANIFHHSDPRTRGAQRLHQKQTQHYVSMSSSVPSVVQSLNGTYSPWPFLQPLHTSPSRVN